MTRTRQLLTGAAALAVVLALVGGVPWALTHFIGWPLPHAIPSWQQLRTGLTTRGIPDALLLKTLAVIVWAAWAVLTLSLTSEALAAVGGLRRPPLPLTGPLQPAAATLITAISVALLAVLPNGGHPHTSRPLGMSLTTGATSLTGQRAPGSATLRVAAVSGGLTGSPATGLTQPDPGVDVTAGRPVVTAATEPERYVIQRRDTLWGIAAKRLGDPLRWHQLFELNAGRPQPDGQTFTDPGRIRPGWTLLLPTTAQPEQAQPHRVRATTRPEVSHTSAPPRTAPPPTTGNEPATGAPAPSVRAGSGGSPPPKSTPDLGHHHDHDGVADREPVLVPASLLAGMTAAGTLALLHRRRRYRPLPPDQADRREPLTARLAGRATHPAPATGCTPPVEPLDPDRMVMPPALRSRAESSLGWVPFALQADGREWHQDLLTGDGLTLIGEGAAAAARGLLLTLLYRTTPAVSHDDPRPERSAAQPVCLDGDVQVLLVDPPQSVLPGTDLSAVRRTTAAAHTHDARVEVERRRALQTERAHETATGQRGPGLRFSQLRHDCPDEQLSVLVLVVQNPDQAIAADLRQLARVGAPVGVTVLTVISDPAAIEDRRPAEHAYPFGSEAEISVAADGLIFVPNSPQIPPTEAVRPAQAFSLSMEQSASLFGLLAAAAGSSAPSASLPEATPARSGAAVPSTEPHLLIDLPPATDHPRAATTVTAQPPEPEASPAGSSPRSSTAPALATIRILGPTVITAGLTEVDVLRRKSVELLVYLACHDRGATAERLAEMLWPQAPPDRSRDRLHTTIGNIRSTLRDLTGHSEQAFVTLTHDRYQLQHDTVTTDLRAFNEPLDQLRTALDPEITMRLLQEATAAFRGEPLTDITADWAEPIREAIRTRALDTHLHLARVHRDRGDHRSEIAALSAARTIDPYAEEVSRQLISAQLRAGERSAALRVFRDLEEKLADLGVDPAPATTALLTTNIPTLRK